MGSRSNKQPKVSSSWISLQPGEAGCGLPVCPGWIPPSREGFGDPRRGLLGCVDRGGFGSRELQWLQCSAAGDLEAWSGNGSTNAGLLSISVHRAISALFRRERVPFSSREVQREGGLATLADLVSFPPEGDRRCIPEIGGACGFPHSQFGGFSTILACQLGPHSPRLSIKPSRLARPVPSHVTHLPFPFSSHIH